MADRPIVKVENNDTIERFKEKVNANFQQLARGAVGSGQTITLIKDNASTDVDGVFDAVYPVGCGIWTNRADDPRLKHGTWVQLKDVFLIAAGSSYPNRSTGGSATVALTVNQMPRHNHSASSSGGGSHSHTVTIANGGAHTHWTEAFANGVPAAMGTMMSTTSYIPGTSVMNVCSGVREGGEHKHTATCSSASTGGGGVSVGYEGGGQAHSNMPPYTARYYFERTA